MMKLVIHIEKTVTDKAQALSIIQNLRLAAPTFTIKGRIFDEVE